MGKAVPAQQFLRNIAETYSMIRAHRQTVEAIADRIEELERENARLTEQWRACQIALRSLRERSHVSRDAPAGEEQNKLPLTPNQETSS